MTMVYDILTVSLLLHCAGIPTEDTEGIPLSPEQSSVLARLFFAATTDQESSAESSVSGRSVGAEFKGLEYIGKAVTLTEEGRWKEAGEMATLGNAMSLPFVLYPSLLVCSGIITICISQTESYTNMSLVFGYRH